MKVSVIIAIILFCSCAESTETAKDEIRAVVSGILDADNHADIERVLSFYDSDALLMPPGRDEIRGMKSIRRNYENIFATSVLSLSPEESEITIANDVAIYRGITKGKVFVKSDSTERVVNDKFLMVLKKVNTDWKISTLIWN